MTRRSRSDRTTPSPTPWRSIYKRAHGAVIIVDEQDSPVGIFTETDAHQVDRFSLLSEVMHRDLVSVKAGTPLEEMFDQLAHERLTVAPVVDQGKLVGAVTRKGALRSALYTPSLDLRGRLQVAVAVGINGRPGDVPKRRSALEPTSWSWTPPTVTRPECSKR